MRIQIQIQLFGLIRIRIQLPTDPDPHLQFTFRYLHAVFTILMNEVTIERQSRANLSEKKTQFKNLN
jgi:hypothetical protein